MVKIINLKNKAITHSRVINILEFDPKYLDIQRHHEIGIYIISYNENPFYLVINDLKGYFECNYDNKYLTLILMIKI